MIEISQGHERFVCISCKPKKEYFPLDGRVTHKEREVVIPHASKSSCSLKSSVYIDSDTGGSQLTASNDRHRFRAQNINSNKNTAGLFATFPAFAI